MNDVTISPNEIESMGRMVAENMPEFLALKKRLRIESHQVRRAVANALSDWAFDLTADMNVEEKQAFLASLKTEIARRTKKEIICVKAELARRGEPLDRPGEA